MNVEIDDRKKAIKASKAERDVVYKLCGVHCYYHCVSPEKQTRDTFGVEQNLFVCLNGSGKGLLEVLHPETDLIEVEANLVIN